MNTVKVLKKDGVRVEEFDGEKILKAIDLASGRVKVLLTVEEKDEILAFVKKCLKGKVVVPVGDMHFYVIQALERVKPEVAEVYKDYRGYKQRFNKTFNRILLEENKLLNEGDKENANKNSEINSTKKELSSGIVSKHIALDYELAPGVAKAHIEGDIHSHDLTDEIYGSINCCLFDMAKVLEDGFTINGIEKNEPQHLETAIDMIGDIILSASSQQYGGFTVPEIDTTIAKYVERGYKEYLKLFAHMRCAYATYEDYCAWVEGFVYDRLKQKLESIEHKLNTINNSNGQTSFTTFTFGLNTSKWGRMVSKALLEVRMKGLGKKRVSAIFPKLVFLHRAEINGEESSPNYDIKMLALNCSIKRMYPDWLSLDEGYLGEMFDKYGLAVSPMGCRAFLSPYTTPGEDKPHFIGRANCGAVSLNLPRFALRSEGDFNKFLEEVDKYFDIAIRKHLYKFNKLKSVKASSNPLFFCEGGCSTRLGYDDTIEEAIKTFTWSIGYIGLEEVCQYFTGKGVSSNERMVIEILEHINKRIEEAKKEHGMLFALYSTPAESLCYRFLKMDRERFGVVKGVTDKEYYTNSYHVCVREKITALRKQEVEAKYFHLAKGGRIVYNEFPHTKNRLAILQCVNKAMRLGLYYGINLQLDTCMECGEHGEFGGKCPKCGSVDILSINRTCGYLGYTSIHGDTRMNEGKMDEIKSRVDHFSE